MATVKKSLIRPTRVLGASKNFENSNPNFSCLTPRRSSTVGFKSSDKIPCKTMKLSKKSPSSSISRGKNSLAKKKIPLKDSASSNLKNVSKVTSLVHLEPLRQFAKQNQRIKIRAPLSSPMEPTPSMNRQPRNLKLNLDEVSNKRDLKNEFNVSDGAPNLGAGRVRFLTKAFERLCTDNEEEEVAHKRDMTNSRVLSEVQKVQKAEEAEIYYSAMSTLSERQGRIDKMWKIESGEQSSVESTLKRNININGGSNMIKRNSIGSFGRSRTKKPKITNANPFNLKTEERGRMKEEQFQEKMKEMLLEEEMLRVPVALGLPWTTDEPEYPFKPPIKEPTEPLDLSLHTDLRAVDRGEFDLQVAEKMNFLEKIKSERERLRKMEEEEEIKRLRKELVPKALPMPCFNRPFFPKRSILPHTVPKEPKVYSKQTKDKP